MARFVAAVVTIVDGKVKAKADPRIADRPGSASLALACTVAESRTRRAGIEAVKAAGREAWRIHHEQRDGSL